MSEYRELTGKQRIDLFNTNRRMLRTIQALEHQLKMLQLERDRLGMELHLLRDIMKAQSKVFPGVLNTANVQIRPPVPGPQVPRARGTRDMKPLK